MLLEAALAKNPLRRSRHHKGFIHGRLYEMVAFQFSTLVFDFMTGSQKFCR
jgi:hypothetical protein